MSGRVHSRHHHQLSDTAAAGREVVVRLQVRRLFCENTDCARKTFAEQIPGVADRYVRRTPAARVEHSGGGVGVDVLVRG